MHACRSTLEDPTLFAGSGTTGAVAAALGRNAVLVDANPEAIEVMRTRMPHASVVT